MRLPKLEAYHLIIFYCVAKEKSISAAAENLCLSQPTITSHIKSLERATNLKLIEVSKQRVHLTPSGEGLYQYAKEIYQQSIYAERFIELMKGSSLVVGVTPIFNGVLAPPIKTMFDEVYPSIKLTVQSRDSRSLVNDVLDSNIDLAVVPLFEQRNPKLSYIIIADEVKLVFFASPANPIFDQAHFEWKDLSRYPLIAGSETSVLRQFTLDKLRTEGLNIDPKMGPTIRSDADLCSRLIKCGNFIGIGIFKDIEEDVNSGRLRVIPFPDDIFIEVCIVVHRNTLLSPLVKKFISFVRDAFNSSTQRPLSSMSI